MNFCANSAKLLRKLDHVLLWVLSNDTRLLQCSLYAEQTKFQWIAMFCLYTFPLAKPAQAEIQILTAICSIVKLIPWKEVNLSYLYSCTTFSINFQMFLVQRFKNILWKYGCIKIRMLFRKLIQPIVWCLFWLVTPC